VDAANALLALIEEDGDGAAFVLATAVQAYIDYISPE
jgi:hypothetical protein